MSDLTHSLDEISSTLLTFALEHMAMQKLEFQDTPVAGQQVIGLILTNSWGDPTKATFAAIPPSSTRDMILSDWMESELAPLGFDPAQDVVIDPNYSYITEDFMKQDWIKPDVRPDLLKLAETTPEHELIDELFIKPLLTKYNIKARNIYYMVPRDGDRSLYTRLVTLEE